MGGASGGGGEEPEHDDLNRDFPEDVGEAPRSALARHIWELCARLRPKLFLDLHEGWGFYRQLNHLKGAQGSKGGKGGKGGRGAAAAKGAAAAAGAGSGTGTGTKTGAQEPSASALVGNPKFSKGSSVIATENALDMAQVMVDLVNANVKEKAHRFEVLSPPIAGGLAKRLYLAFGTQAFVLETTQQNQTPEKRVAQHLRMVGGLFSRIGFLPAKFRPAKVKPLKHVHSSSSSASPKTQT